MMLVISDADGMPPSHAVEFFGLHLSGPLDLPKRGVDRCPRT